MRTLAMLVIGISAAAQQPPFTLDQALGFAFPTELVPSPAGGKVAWIENRRGVRNVIVAEPPAYQARKITAYTEDDGQDLSDLVWIPDGSAVLYTRGEGPNGAGESANPALDPRPAGQDVWVVPLNGGGPRQLGAGSSPAVSSRGRVVFVHAGQIWTAAQDGKSAAPLFRARGACARPVWSPDGARLAFESHRGDHAFIGIYEANSGALYYPDPSTDYDLYPEWSPDSRSIAFIRIPSSGLRPVREARRAAEPWSIRVASADPTGHAGAGRERWRANNGTGSVFRDITARNPLLWAGDRLVFPWERDGWTHLYSMSVSREAASAGPTLLTPGAFEVEQVAVAGGSVIFNSNQGDLDRRHLWRVAVTGGAPERVTGGEGIEWSPVPLSDGRALAFLRSDAQRPARAAIRIGSETRDLDPGSISPGFPARSMIVPQPVVLPAADGLQIHGQLFLPPNRPSGRRSPAVVFFHGGPQRQMLLGWHYRPYYSNAYALNEYLANSGYVVLAVNFRSGIGYGMEFREALHFGASGASDFLDVAAAGKFLAARSDVDPRRIAAWGGSYGGYLTAMAMARAPSIYTAGVDFAGVHDWALELGVPVAAPDYKVAYESSPVADLSGWRAPVLFIQGDDDRDVLFKNTVILADALRRRNVEVEELIFPDEVHEFLLYRSWRAAYEATARFLDRRLKD
jgi:dipeptidyl aminopeptidase/acylaminoacyl peptidase